MIVDTTFNLKSVEGRTIRECIDKYPDITQVKLCKLLGISYRTLFRKLKDHNIDWHNSDLKTKRSISYLLSKGYEIKPPKS